MIGHDHLGKLWLGEFDVHFMLVCPLWSYVRNLMMIQQNLAKICEFQCKRSLMTGWLGGWVAGWVVFVKIRDQQG